MRLFLSPPYISLFTFYNMHRISVHPLSVSMLRVMLSSIFVVAGISHFSETTHTVQRLENAPLGSYASIFGSPDHLVIASGAVMIISGLLFMAGIKTRWNAVILTLVLIPITLTVQVGDSTSIGPLFKNIAIQGGLLFFILNPIPTANKNPK